MRYLPLLLILAACGGDSNGPQIEPASFQLVSGADQVATVAKDLPELIEVRVLDAAAGSVPNYPTNWTAPDGGVLFAPVAYSGTDGIARQRFTVGTQAWANAGGPGTPDPAQGPMRYRLVVRALHPETGDVLVDDTVFATAVPDVAVALQLLNADLGDAGDSSLMAVVYRDAHQNALAGCPDGGSWQRITWSSSDSSIAVPTGNYFESVGWYSWIRAIASGPVTIGAETACGGFTAEINAAVR